MSATTDTFFKLLEEGIERNARRVVFDHLLSGSLPDPLIGSFKRLLCYGSTQTGAWAWLEEQIRIHHLLHNESKSDQWVSIEDMPNPLILNCVIKNPNEKRLSFL